MIHGGENSEQRQIQSSSIFRKALPWVLTGTAGLASATLATTDMTVTPSMVAGVTGISAAEVTATVALGYGAFRFGRSLLNRAKNTFKLSGKKRKRDSEEDDDVKEVIPPKKVVATDKNGVQPSDTVLEQDNRPEMDVQELLDVAVPQEVAPAVGVLSVTKSDRKTYEEHLLATITHIAEIRRELNRCKTLFNVLDKIEALALDANFNDEGALTAEQPGRNKLQFLRWEEKVLAQLQQSPSKEQAAYKREIAEKSAAKLEKASNKPMI